MNQLSLHEFNGWSAGEPTIADLLLAMKTVTLKPFFPLIATLVLLFLGLAILGQGNTPTTPSPAVAADAAQATAFRNVMEGIGWLAIAFGSVAGVIVAIYSAFNRTALKEWKERAGVRQEKILELEKDLAERKLRNSTLKLELTELREENRDIHDVSLRRKALLDNANISDASVAPDRRGGNDRHFDS